MTKEQLAEQKYPVTTFRNMWEEAVVKRERAAFIKGLEINEEFMRWIDNKSPQLETSWQATFKLFLTEKYGNEQAPKKQA